MVNALYYTESFRDNVVNYPPLPLAGATDGDYSKAAVSVRDPAIASAAAANAANQAQKGQPAPQPGKKGQLATPGLAGPGQQPVKPEDKPDSPEYKKKQAMLKGPVLELSRDSTEAYGMKECTFTGLKDIFTALIDSPTRTGVLSPQRFLDIFKRDNEMFRNSMHQDAHEFYGLVLNDVIASVEANAQRLQERERSLALKDAKDNGTSTAIAKTQGSPTIGLPGTGWVHDIFEGVLTSETKCLTCETTSQRDETFLDLSIDLEEHSSVTSCLRKFSAEEMLCERNKFHCDHCGGLQEAEKRMKIKRLPKVLALHLKRFKYTEDYSRLQKLFHRVVYPYHLRMFNTTDGAEDPDRMYELYAVVIHIGGNAYHGHYVAVIKTQDRGWLLFDDEMVEPVDKHFVRNFFGDKPGMACAYVLFYQETTFEKMREEQEAEGLEEVKLASQKADLASGDDRVNGIDITPLSKLHAVPAPLADEHDSSATLAQVQTAPGLATANPSTKSEDQLAVPESTTRPLVATLSSPPATTTRADETPAAAPKTKQEKEREKKELKAQEKARKAAEKEQAKIDARERVARQARLLQSQKNEHQQLQKALQESKEMAAEEAKRRKMEGAAEAASNGNHSPGFLNRANRGSKSMARKSFGFLGKTDKSNKADKADNKADKSDKGEPVPIPEKGENVDKGDGSSTTESSGRQNGSASALLADKLDKPLKERFSFGLGRKKTEKSSS